MGSNLASDAAFLGVPLDAERVALLERFEDLLRERGVPNGMVAESDLPRLRARHVLDCLRAAAVVEELDREAYDLGSGAGLPGIVVAICAPWLDVRLVESRRNRAAFLELVVERLALGNAEVVLGRIEGLSVPVDLCFARALASLRRSWELAARLLRPGGRLVYFAGSGLAGADRLPGASSVRLLPAGPLESAGTLVIMARQ